MSAKTKPSAKSQNPRHARILVPTDFSGHAEEALHFAIPLARQIGGKITLLHVLDWQADSGISSAMGVMNAIGQSADDAKRKLDRLAKKIVPENLLDATVVRVARPHLEIAKAARDLKTDVIVISTHGHTGLKRVILGSTADRVVRHATCPVLTVRAIPAGKKSPSVKGRSLAPVFKRILLPVDFSEDATDSVRFAGNLAKLMRAKLTLLHVVASLPLNAARYRAEIREYDAEIKAEAKTKLQALAATIPGVKTQLLIRQETPFHGVIDAAEELDTDLIVIPTRGFTGLKNFFLGSTAEKVVRNATRPVLTFTHHATKSKTFAAS